MFAVAHVPIASISHCLAFAVCSQAAADTTALEKGPLYDELRTRPTLLIANHCQEEPVRDPTTHHHVKPLNFGPNSALYTNKTTSLYNAGLKHRQRIQEMRGFLGIRSPSSLRCIAGDKMTASLSPTDTKKVDLVSRFSKSNERFRTPQHADPANQSVHRRHSFVENQEDQPVLTNGQCLRHLPPLYKDILWLSLTLIERPAAQMQCQMCKLGFSSRLRQDDAAWRIHGCGHYIHAVCLRNFSVQTTAEPNGGCRTCESLRCQLQSIPEEEEREAKIARLEQALFPWKRDFR